jgi:phage terminase large subunit-like protein
VSTVIQEIATLSTIQQRAFLDGLNEPELYDLLYNWEYWARPDQLTPKGDYNVWLILSGRGWGKTRTAAEDVKLYGLARKNSRIAVVAPTYADARDTCIEGESGLLNILPPDRVAAWNRSLGELALTNGTKYKLFSAEEPERMRGPQHHRAWFDELCAAKNPQEAWTQLVFGLRLGKKPQVVVTTTPKPITLLKELVQRKDVHVTRGTTFDNAANLAPAALATLRARYGQSRTGRQELYGEILDDVEGALWKRSMIEDYRVTNHPQLKRIVVAIDPAVTAEEGSDETGIVVAGVGIDNHGYILADKSLRASPNDWAGIAVAAYNVFHADRIIGEVNNGGDLIETVIRSIDRHVSYSAVRASRGKQLRAEPVSSLYERGLVHHVGAFPELEDQQCSWEPGQASPDRVDALTWAITELMITNEPTADEQIEAMKRRAELAQLRTALPAKVVQGWPG